jgi:glycerate kinase
MNIAVFSDKFSGTLSAIEVLDIVQSQFLDSNINADFFSVTDGGPEGVSDPKSSLEIATNGLIKEIQKH